MKRDIEKRLLRLEDKLLPKPVRPMLLIVEKHEDLKGNPVDADGRPLPVMIMGRPRPAVKADDDGALTIRVVHTHGPKAAKADDPNTRTITRVDTIVHGPKAATAADPEPSDKELAGAIADLERRAAEIRPDPDPEPEDADLEREIERLERRLKDGGGRHGTN